MLRIVRLSNVLDKYKDDLNGAFNDKSLKSLDEIGSLSRTLNKLFGELHDKNKIIKDNHDKAENRYKRHTQMTKIYGHDIRTPIDALLSLSDSQTESIKYIKQIELATEAIMQAAEFEESLSKSLIISPFNLVSFGHAITKGATNIRENNNNFIFHTHYQNTLISADEEVLEDAIDCVINNACDFGHNVTITTDADSEYGIIEVFNDGEQIEESKIEVIFDYGASFRKKSSQQHYGIGLFGARLRIEVMGGTIIATNKKNGVAFIIAIRF